MSARKLCRHRIVKYNADVFERLDILVSERELRDLSDDSSGDRPELGRIFRDPYSLRDLPR